MRYFKRQTAFFAFTGGKTTIIFAMVVAISMLSISPAFADHDRDNGGGGWRGNGGGERREHGGEWHGHQGWRGNGGGNQYGYAQPIYAPPPVYYYPPQPSPGINVLFPLNFRIH